MKFKEDKGFTLIELLVAMAIVSIVMAAVVAVYQVQVRGNNTQEALTDMNQTARAAMEIMVGEIRLAGCDVLKSSGAAILAATPNQLSFTMDIGDGASFQPDGDTNDPNERVIYSLYVDGDGNQNLGRDTGGGPQPLARNVDALDFVYFDEDGNPPGALNDIRSIQINLVARAGEAAGGLLYAHRDTVAYQNQQGVQILAAQNDAFRRLQLSTTANCYNMRDKE